MSEFEDSEFQGKVVVITGAGNGLGRSHAHEFAKRGAKVVVNDLGGAVDGSGAGDAADTVVGEIEAMGGSAIANKASVSDKAGAKSIIDDAISAFGRVDILVNNAGILRDKSFKKMTLEEWDLVLQVHLNGSAYVTHAVWPLMLEQKYGRVVLTSSGSGIYGNFGQSNYGAAKMGMLGMMNVLAIEGAKNNVRVNTLAPGAATRMIASIPGRDIDPDNPPPESAPKLVSPAVLYMCSEEAPNGVVINAMGGKYYRSQVFVNDAVKLGIDATFEDLETEAERLLDMSAAHPPNRGA
jgi:NAD(P)-dependent dehydrogenase (short-subunit alcohol dehydrogenase family)